MKLINIRIVVENDAAHEKLLEYLDESRSVHGYVELLDTGVVSGHLRPDMPGAVFDRTKVMDALAKGEL